MLLLNSFPKTLFILFAFILVSCGKKDVDKKPKNTEDKTQEIKYAKGFDIKYYTDYTKLIIKHPYPKAKESFEYILYKNQPKKKGIHVPISKIVVSSTTHIPMLELLNEQDKLVGFQNTKYVSSLKTRKRIDEGKIKELGKEFALNTELLFDLKPDVLIGFAMTKTNKAYNLVEENGIPVIINNDWLEETPLGRAEWIKFFGVLFDKKAAADSIFKNIENNYINATALAKKDTVKPTILSGVVMQNDIWSLPAGESFVAQFLQDANLNYLWKDTKGKGSLNLSFESVFNKANNADFWIAPGHYTTKKQLLDSNEHYVNFSAFKQNKIYSSTLKTGPTGGVLYYELAAVRPDLVLKDLIKITKPHLLPNYSLTFFEQMK